jgi:hypothetical protein
MSKWQKKVEIFFMFFEKGENKRKIHFPKLGKKRSWLLAAN